MTEWITTDDLKSALGVLPSDTSDDEWLARSVAAGNALVTGFHPDLDTPADWPQYVQGTLELAVKLYRSRAATDDGTGSFDVYSYAARYLDANVRLLLDLDRPVVG